LSIGKRTDIRVVDGEQNAVERSAVSYEDMAGLSSKWSE